jgi:Dihydrofolate reductase
MQLMTSLTCKCVTVIETVGTALQARACALLELAGAQHEHCNTFIASVLQMLRKKIYLIAAVSRNGVIGEHGKLPWSLPADRDRFLWLTAGHIIVYGRKTYEQELRRAIPGRLNIVVSSNPAYRLKDALTATSVKHAIQLSQVRASVVFGLFVFLHMPPLLLVLFTRKTCLSDAAYCKLIDRQQRAVSSG